MKIKLKLEYYKTQLYTEEIEMDVDLEKYGLTLDKDGNIDEDAFYSNYDETNEDEASYSFDDSLECLGEDVEEKLCNDDYSVLKSIAGQVIEDFGHVLYTNDDRIIYEI